jgi:hypothetical protein
MVAICHDWRRYLIAAMVVAIPGSLAAAQTAANSPNPPPLASLSLFAQDEEATTEETTTVTVTEEAASPYSFDLSYSYYTDHVWRGLNLSEYAGEGREKPNHQVDASVTIDIGLAVGQDPGTCGIFTFGAWGQWFAAQKKLDPVGGGQNLQRADYYLDWSYDLESIDTTLGVGYRFYTYPNNTWFNTQEWSLSFAHNDAWMWTWLWPDNEDGVLNPTFAFYQDTRLGGWDAVWMELGFSHAFGLMENVTLTPSWTLGIDHNYYRGLGLDNDHTTRFATMVWGLDLTYDMAEIVPLPEGWGSMSLSGFVYFSDALGNAEDNGIIQDEFFGGMSLGWSF